MQRAWSWLKKTIYIAIAGVLLFALSINVIRQNVPALNQHKAWFAHIMSTILHSPVEIERMHLSWFQYQPVLTFDEVTVFYPHATKKQSTLFIRQVRVFFSLFKSLRHLSIRTNGVIIEGVKVKAVQREPNRIVVEDIPFSTDFDASTFKPDSELQELLQWFSQQTGVVVKNVWVRYEDEIRHKRHTFFINNLAFLNSNEFHYWRGNATLMEKIPVNVDLAVKWHADLSNLTNLKKTLRARLYLTASKINLNAMMDILPLALLSSWQAEIEKRKWSIEHGLGTFQFWVNLHLGELRSVQAQMNLENVAMRFSDKTHYVFPKIAAHLGYKKQGRDAVLAGNDILIDFSDHFWPVTDFYIQLRDRALDQQPAEWQIDRIRIGYVNLYDMWPFALPYVPPEYQKWISTFAPYGEIEDLRLTFDPHSSSNITEATGRVVNMGFNNQVHALSGFSTAFSYRNDELLLNVQSQRLRWQDAKVFKTALALDVLQGQLRFSQLTSLVGCLPNGGKCTVAATAANQKNALAPHIEIQNFHAKNADLEWDTSGRITFRPDGTAPDVNLQGAFAFTRLEHFSPYLPVKIMKPNLVTWLKGAFHGGALTQGKFIVRGHLTDFPFDAPVTDGLFKVTAQANNVDFNFAPGWPHLMNSSAEITFLNKSLFVTLHQAMLQNIPVADFRGEIIELFTPKPSVVDVSGAVNTNLEAGLDFLHASPLEKTVGKKLQPLSADGKSHLILGLHVPLKFPEKTQVQGELQLQQARVAFPAWKLQFEQVNGVCYFDENSFHSPIFPVGIQATLWKRPVVFSIETVRAGKPDALLRVWLTLRAGVKDIQQWLNITDKNRGNINGETDFTTITSVFLKKNQPLRLELHSDLKGLSFQQNAFLKKSAEQKIAFTTAVTFDSTLKARVQYGNAMNAALLLSHKNNIFSLQAVSLSLGKQQAVWPTEPGILLHAAFNKLNEEEVQRYLDMDYSTSALPPSLPLKRIWVEAEQARLLGLVLNNARLEIAVKNSVYHALLQSRQVVGDIKAKQLPSKRWDIDAQLSKFQLEPGKQMKSHNISDWAKLHQLRLRARQFRYQNLLLDELQLVLSASGDGFRVRTNAKSNNVEWQADGSMYPQPKQFRSQLHGQLKLKKTDEFLQQMNLITGNSLLATHGQTDFSLNWKGTLFSPELSSLSGAVQFNVASGSILNLKETSGAAMSFGRFLSLISVQNLPRHLLLDFGDVKQGYVFDSIKGALDLKQGHAHAKNLLFSGPIANILIAGNIGLTTKQLDLKVYVQPMVSATSLPVAASVLVGQPVIGVAALVLGGLTHQTKTTPEKSSYGYSVTGNWNAPIWTQLKR